MPITWDDVVHRSPLAGQAEAYSGATFERVELAGGQRLVLKHLPRDGDWLTRASGAPDRLRRLWSTGVLDRIGAVVDHTVVDIVESEGHDIVVMRDVSDSLIPEGGNVGRSTSRRLLAGLAALHELGRTEPAQDLCPIGARYRMFAPDVHARPDLPGAHPAHEMIVGGWELFADRAPTDVVDAVFAVHADPSVLERSLAAFPKTLLHGDAKLPNLGLAPTGLVAVDWGDLSGFGPREVDVAWYALMNERRVGVTPDVTFSDYDAVATRPLDPVAVDLTCIGSLAQMGFKLAATSCRGADPELRARAAASLDWWCDRVRVALDRAY